MIRFPQPARDDVCVAIWPGVADARRVPGPEAPFVAADLFSLPAITDYDNRSTAYKRLSVQGHETARCL